MLSALVLGKIEEQIERTAHLVRLVPVEQLQWRPPMSGSWTAGELLGHLLDCMAGFCAVLYSVHPEALAHFAALRDLPVNYSCAPEDACERIAVYLRHIDEGFALLTDDDLERKLSTVFVPAGEYVATLLLGNLEHLTNHKYQLFTYLKLLSVNVGTPDLYRFRE